MMKERRFVGVLGLAVSGFCVAAPAFGQTPAETAQDARLAPVAGGLTAEQVGSRAEQTSFNAAALRQALHAADARLEQAKIAYYPKLTLTGSYTRLSNIEQPTFSLPNGQGGTASFD